MSYQAPLKDMLFAMQELAGLSTVTALPGMEDYDLDTAQAVLEESAKFCQDVVAPLNWEGDKNPSSWKDGVVTTTPGFKEAYAQFAEGGWHTVCRNVACRQPVICAVPHADRRCYRGAAGGGQ